MKINLTSWYQKSFRNKLVTTILGIFMVVYFPTLHWAYAKMSSDILQAAQKESTSNTAILAMALYRSFDLETDKREILGFMLGSKQYRENITSIRVFDAKQTIISSTDLRQIGSQIEAPRHLTVLNNKTQIDLVQVEGLPAEITVFYPISAGIGKQNQPVGFIEAHYDISSLTTTLVNLKQYFVLGGLLIAVGMALALTQIASSMTQPMRQLHDAMKQVEDNRLNISVPIRSQDEIGFLSMKFNSMIESLRQSHDNLKQLVTASLLFVPAEFLDMLGRRQITDVALGDARQMTLTVLFLDIRDFTRLSSNLTAYQILEFLNVLNQYLMPCIQSHGGFVDKYIGDAIMAIFPHSPDDAVTASQQMIAALARFNAEKPLPHIPNIDIGIGINSGEAIIGTVGTAARMDTTVIGDTVNLASRMESLTKTLGVRILMTERVYGLLQSDTINNQQIEKVGEYLVKGVTAPVTAYGIRC